MAFTDKLFTSLAKPLLTIICSRGFESMQLKNSSLIIRSAEGSKGGLLLLPVTSAVWLSRISKIAAANYLDHPFIETKGLKAETCPEGHPTKDQGRVVHAAVGIGCENRHRAASKTIIPLRPTGANKSAKYHEIKKEPVLQGPFPGGRL